MGDAADDEALGAASSQEPDTAAPTLPDEPVAATVPDEPAASPKKKKSKQKAKQVAADALRRNRRLRVGLYVLGVVAVVLLAGCVVLGIRVLHDRHIDSARSGALRAAQQYAVDFSSYDYRNLDQNFSRTAADLTGSFKTSYTQTAAALKATIVQYQETSTTKIVAAAVQSVSPHHAVVLVILDQTVTGSNLKTPTVNRDRAMLTLVRTGSGRWLVQNLDLP